MNGLNVNKELEQVIHNIMNIMKEYSCSCDEYIENINLMLEVLKNYEIKSLSKRIRY